MSNRYSLAILFFLVIFCYCGNAKAQRSKIDSLKALIKNDGQDTLRILHLNAIGNELRASQPDTSIVFGLEAIELAIRLEKNAKDETKKKAIQKLLGTSYSNVGVYYHYVGDFSTSLSYYIKSLEIRTAIDDQQGIAHCLGNMGMIYYIQGDYPKGLDFTIQSMNINIRIGSEIGVAKALGQIGNIYYKSKEFEKAYDCYLKALNLFEKLETKMELGVVLGNLGAVSKDLKRYSKAMYYYQRSLKIAEEMDNRTSMAMMHSNIGVLHTVNAEWDKALESYNKSLEISINNNFVYLIAANELQIGNLFWNQDKYAESESHLMKGYDIATEIGALDMVKECAETLSNVYAKTNRFDLAYKYHLKFTEAKDSLFNDDKSKEIGKLEARHEIEKAETERLAQEEAEHKTKLETKNRKDLLQYSGILLLLLLIGLVVVVLTFKKVSPQVASGVTFFAFLLLFEFFLVYLDSYMEKWSGGEPAYKLALNAVLAACIFPLHAFFNKVLKSKLVKRT